MLKGQLEAVRLRIANYKDEQAKADAQMMVEMIETLLEDTTVAYHHKHRDLLSTGVHLEKSERTGQVLWKASTELKQKGDVSGDYRIDIESLWTPAVHEAFDIVMEIATQIRMGFLIPATVYYPNDLSDDEKRVIADVAKRWKFIMADDHPDAEEYDRTKI